MPQASAKPYRHYTLSFRLVTPVYVCQDASLKVLSEHNFWTANISSRTLKAELPLSLPTPSKGTVWCQTHTQVCGGKVHDPPWFW